MKLSKRFLPPSHLLYPANNSQLMQDIESKAAFSQQQLTIVKAQMAAKQRDIRLLQLTGKELEKLPAGTRTYESIGKMYVLGLG